MSMTPAVPKTKRKRKIDRVDETACSDGPTSRNASITYSSGKWVGNHMVSILKRSEDCSTCLGDGDEWFLDISADSAKQAKLELEHLQGLWHEPRKNGGEPCRFFFVRGLHVEEKREDGKRVFSNLRSSISTSDPKVTEIISQSVAFASSRSLTQGKWQWKQHSTKCLFWEAGRQQAGAVRWLHDLEEIRWSRGGPVLERMRVRYDDGHIQDLFRHEEDVFGEWRARKGFRLKVEWNAGVRSRKRLLDDCREVNAGEERIEGKPKQKKPRVKKQKKAKRASLSAEAGDGT